ncbi:type IV / vi secretion system protein, dotu family [Mesorhizobium sp. L-8-10]|uniref:type VI secretion system protein TssL, long form n=1 Tax=Mesorhizobium sp. L-8-10 TaxID=2744523 RepID=UPI0019279690|nr:type VI secretion system protein TssL, long form [Mesorhizobium sp. L-8-10]BCH33446.1 type IV / vi secretion system protein, dotu family [Mesorhizobium sp. L-8-10]
MSIKDEPIASGDRTIIRPVPTGSPKSVPAGTPPQRSRADVEPVSSPATIISPQAGRASTQDWPGATVIADAAPGGWPGVGPTVLAGWDGAPASEASLEPVGGAPYPGSNPLIAAAAPLLLLLGRLRTKQVEPLMDGIAEAIRQFERQAGERNVPAEEIRIAKYALCEVADDIVRNLPGSDRQAWIRNGMVSKFFQGQASGAGFFEALNRLLADPHSHYHLLELMHACLGLGFEGQYRGLADGGSGLMRVRGDVYETLRVLEPQADDISPRSQDPSATTARASASLPLWAVAAAGLVLLAVTYAAMRFTVERQSDAAVHNLLALNPPTAVTIERTAPAPVIEEPRRSTRLDRIRAALAAETALGNLIIEPKDGFIVMEINNLLLFQPGKAELRPEFEPVAGRIAAALEPEPGPIKVVGHTDDVKPSRSSAFKSNYDLSLARAEAVKELVAPRMSDGSRLSVEGKGEDVPIADNKTPEGRARNRRVELMIPQEETP